MDSAQVEALLKRAEVKLNLDEISHYLTGVPVLVTGAGGSIGSEICRQVAAFRPRQILLVGHGEYSIYEMDMELRARFPGLDIQPLIADIQDQNRMDAIFATYRPAVVFHTAAHKHVPLMERNPGEAVKNNILGTYCVAQAAHSHGAKRFVLISTDKAVHPASIMGATKRAAEYIVRSFAQESATIFVTVRFGNVLGSRGSVLQLFERQIAAGGPVTVTDPRMFRFFMTITEAARLVIQAAAIGCGGEIFVLDMGQPIRIIDLARDLIRQAGLEPGKDIQIVYTGIRPGEKLHEELLTLREAVAVTRAERIFVVAGGAAGSGAAGAPLAAASPGEMERFVAYMRELVATGSPDYDEVLDALGGLTERSMKEYGAVGTGS